jgi:hypothetical protein
LPQDLCNNAYQQPKPVAQYSPVWIGIGDASGAPGTLSYRWLKAEPTDAQATAQFESDQ